MPSLFRRNRFRNPGDGLYVRVAPSPTPSPWTGIVEKYNGFSFVPRSLRLPKRGSHKDGRRRGASVPTASISTSETGSRLLDLEEYTALLLQAAAEHDAGLKLDAEDDLPVPPSTPLQDSDLIGRHSGTADPIVQGVTYDAILASTVSKSLNGMMTDDSGRVAPPEASPRVPPNSPVGTLRMHKHTSRWQRAYAHGTHQRRYVSLVGASMAIMENRV